MFQPHRFNTRARARFAVGEYIEVFYNRQRLHSSLGYRTPALPHEALSKILDAQLSPYWA